MLKVKSKQGVLIVMCWLVYISSYVARYSYNANIVSIIGDYGVSKTDAGLVGTFFFVAYGAGQIINGLLCKKYDKRIVISMAIIISGIINLLMFFKPTFVHFKYFWLINGFSLSILWSSLICTLGTKLDSAHLPKAIIVMSSPVALGTVSAYGLSALFNLFDYKYIFLFASVLAISVGVVWYVGFKKFYETGITVTEKPLTEEGADEKSNKSAVNGAIGFVMVLGLFAIVNNLIKDGLATWVPTILKETYGFDDSISILFSIVLPMLGFCGSVTALRVCKRISNFVIVLGIFYTVAVIFVLSVVLSLGSPLVWLLIASFGVIALLMYGVNNVITSIAPLSLREKFSAGTLAGVMDGCCYIGSAISSFGLGAIADAYGWNTVFYILLGVTVFAVALSVVAFFVSKVNKSKTAKENGVINEEEKDKTAEENAQA